MPFWPSKSKKSKKKGKEKENSKIKEVEGDEEEEIEPIDLLADVIIGFLEASTSYLRTIANQAFGYLAAMAKESTIDLLVSVSPIHSCLRFNCTHVLLFSNLNVGRLLNSQRTTTRMRTDRKSTV